MTTHARAMRMPRDVRARERLREAQAAEAAAVSAVCGAQDALSRAAAKREQVIAATDADLARARHALAVRHAELIEISGLERAASLLGIDRGQLRKSVAAANARADDLA